MVAKLQNIGEKVELLFRNVAEKPYICAEMAAHNELGKWGEAEAAEYLRRHGYVIRDTDWRFGKRDLDIVAVTEDAQCLVFVEVKTRKSDKVQTPVQAVTRQKIRNLAIAANAYVKTVAGDFQLRFDIISIVGSKDKVEAIEHIEDAFNPLLG